MSHDPSSDLHTHLSSEPTTRPSVLRRARRGFAIALGIGVAAAAVAVAVTGPAAGAERSGAGSERALTAVKRATAAYHDPARAVAVGFVPTEACVADPVLGGMGMHYVNPARLADPAIDPTAPEILVYEPGERGRPKLVALEWFSADADQDLATDDDRPSLFGVAFDGPMPGHEPGMPVHYDLHAWVWKNNPSGRFAPWNPDVSCPG